MVSARHLLVLVATLACAFALAGSAPAAAPPGARTAVAYPLPFTLGSPHFLVHYMSDASSGSLDKSAAITETQAGDVLGYAEEAYAAEVGTYGFPAPPSDGVLGGDGRIDIYVVDFAGTGIIGETFSDGAGPTTSASFSLDAQKGLTPGTVAHELFHVLQLGLWLPSSASDYWLLEETAEWMAAKVSGYGPGFVADLGPPDISLDCKDALGTEKCDLADGYKNGAYSRWPFWESVTERYGVGFVKEVFQQGLATPGADAVTALSQALVAHGSTLAAAFTNWSVQQMAGSYGVDALDQVKPVTYGAPLLTGTTTQTLPAVQVPVDHLATRYLELDRGDGAGAGGCFAATLNLTVSLPAGVSSQPSFYWNGLNSSPVSLAVSGSTATASLPWDTCTWAGNHGYLALPNPSTDPTANGAVFTVTVRLVVDPTTPGQAALPPAPVSVTGPVVQVPSADVAPMLAVFGPELLQVSSKGRVVRLVVQSSGDGKLQASLGGLALGVATLRAGNNDVRFVLPRSSLAGLRRSSGGTANVLRLTPVSSSGAATGAAVLRTVALAQARPPKATPTANTKRTRK